MSKRAAQTWRRARDQTQLVGTESVIFTRFKIASDTPDGTQLRTPREGINDDDADNQHGHIAYANRHAAM